MATNLDFSEFIMENKKLLKEYADARLELFKLQGVKLLSKSLSMFIWLTIVLFFAFFILLFLGLLFAYWIAEKTGSNTIGFASAAGLFIVILLLVFSFINVWFQTPISNTIIREALDDDGNEP